MTNEQIEIMALKQWVKEQMAEVKHQVDILHQTFDDRITRVELAVEPLNSDLEEVY